MRLVPATPADAERLYAALKPEELQNFSFFEQPVTLERERKYLEGHYHSGKSFLYVIEGEGENVLGTIGLHEYDQLARMARLGVTIFDSANRHKHFGTEAILQQLEIGYEDIDLNRIYVNVKAENLVNRSYYEHLGFVYEGTLREYYWSQGQFHDMATSSLLKREWLAKYKSS